MRFSVAARVLRYPYHVKIYDGREDSGEDRWAVKLTLDPKSLPPLTVEQRAELEAVASTHRP